MASTIIPRKPSPPTTPLKSSESELRSISMIVPSAINNFSEIIIIGSGKGVASVNYINNSNWKRTSLKYCRILSKIYQQAVSNCPRYNG